jgi:hypothetical protein
MKSALEALISALILSALFFLLGILFIIFFSSFIPAMDYVWAEFLVSVTLLLGFCGFFIFLNFDIPAWCQWKKWKRLLLKGELD